MVSRSHVYISLGVETPREYQYVILVYHILCDNVLNVLTFPFSILILMQYFLLEHVYISYYLCFLF